MTETRNKRSTTLADRFLKQTRDAHRPVSLYLVSGFQLKGEIVDFDEETVLFNHKDTHQLVMRSAVVSMYPLLKSDQDASEWWRSYTPAEMEQ